MLLIFEENTVMLYLEFGFQMKINEKIYYGIKKNMKQT